MKNKVVLLVMMVLCSSFSFYSNHSDKEKIKLMQCDNWQGSRRAQFDVFQLDG
jgi:hypothetical protein